MEIVLTITIFVTKYDIKTANIQVITNWRNNLMNGIKNTVKVTVQFETKGNGQNEIFSHMDRSEVKL